MLLHNEKYFLSQRLTLDESNSRLSVENYGLVRAAEDVMYFFLDRRHLLQQAFKEKLRRRNYP